MYIKRAIEETLKNLSAAFPVLLLTGPRQVGKTTTLKRLARDGRNYVTLDDTEARLLAKRDPALFLQRYAPPVLIDEIQYAPELLPYIKIAADRTEEKGLFWLTGSQTFHTMRDVSESLAGRVGVVRMLGLSGSEIDGIESEPFTTSPERLLARAAKARKKTVTEIFERIYRGGMPALYAQKGLDQELFYSSYINTYLQRDIRDLSQVGDEMNFYRFMTAAAARTARPLVYDELAREVGVSAPTVKKWVSILVSSQIVALLQPYHNNALKRALKTPLLHFLDTGLCAHLLRWGSAQTLESGAMSGAFFESWVFSEIYKSYLNAGKQPPLYYYRDKDKREIDILLLQDGTLYPVEVKKSAAPGARATQHFGAIDPIAEPERFGAAAQYKTQIGEGAVICMAEDLLPADRKNWYVPAWLI